MKGAVKWFKIKYALGFLLFTCKRLLWAIKDKGESWTGEQSPDIILTRNVISFLNNE